MRITIGRMAIVLGLMATAAGIAWSVMPRPIPVETATVTKGHFVARVDEDGRITMFTQDDATIVPTGALFRRGETWNVYVANDGRAQDREIKLLRRSGRFTAVAAGIAPRKRRLDVGDYSKAFVSGCKIPFPGSR